MSKTISVAMCTFNGSRFVAEQLTSIAAQTRLPDELMICDDCSGDETPQVVEAFAGAAPFPVHLQVNEQNLGLTKNFERAISLCNGDLIALSDQDDVWLPEKLARMESVFGSSPNLGLVFSDAELVDENRSLLGKRLWELLDLSREERKRLREGNAIGDLLLGSIVTGATLCFRSSLREIALPFPDNLPMIHDGWLALIASCVSQVLPLEEPLVLYRQHQGQQVGALERRGNIGGFKAISQGEGGEAMRRPNSYREVLSVAHAVHQRLTETHDGEFDKRKSLPEIESRIAHLEVRANLPGSALLRLSVVLREFFKWRYSRYSNGISSAAKDLLHFEST